MAKNQSSPESPAAKQFIVDVSRFIEEYVAQQARVSLNALDSALANRDQFCQCPQCRGGIAIIFGLQKEADYWHKMLGQPDMGTNQVIIASNLATLPSKILDVELKFNPDSDLCGNCSLYDLCENSIQNGNQNSPCRYNLDN